MMHSYQMYKNCKNLAAQVAAVEAKKYNHFSPAFRELQWENIRQTFVGHGYDPIQNFTRVLSRLVLLWFQNVQGVICSVPRQLHVSLTNRHTRNSGVPPGWAPGCGTLLHAPSHRHLSTLTTYKARLKKFLLTQNVRYQFSLFTFFKRIALAFFVLHYFFLYVFASVNVFHYFNISI